jgi:hypothetical protein
MFLMTFPGIFVHFVVNKPLSIVLKFTGDLHLRISGAFPGFLSQNKHMTLLNQNMKPLKIFLA